MSNNTLALVKARIALAHAEEQRNQIAVMLMTGFATDLDYKRAVAKYEGALYNLDQLELTHDW